jgi:hypothetical protein
MAWVSHGAISDESVSWYSPSTPNTLTSLELASEDDESVARSIEIDLESLEERSPTSFWLSRLEERSSDLSMSQPNLRTRLVLTMRQPP